MQQSLQPEMGKRLTSDKLNRDIQNQKPESDSEPYQLRISLILSNLIHQLLSNQLFYFAIKQVVLKIYKNIFCTFLDFTKNVFLSGSVPILNITNAFINKTSFINQTHWLMRTNKLAVFCAAHNKNPA